MPRRLNSESFFYLNVRSRFNHKASVQFAASKPSPSPATTSLGFARKFTCALATLLAMSTSIREAGAQTQPQTSAAASNVAPAVTPTATPSVPPAKAPAAPITAAGSTQGTAPKAAATGSVPALAPSTTAPVSSGAASATGTTSTPNPTVAPPLQAASPEQQAVAQNALTTAQQAYAKGEYQSAEQQYRTAFAAVPSAQAQHGIASSLDLQAKPTEAFDAYTELLARTDLDQLPPSDVTHARERAEVLGKIPAVVRLAVISNEQLVSGAKVLVDGAEQATLELRLTPGPHRLQVLATGYQDFEQTLELKPAQVLDLPVELAPVPAPPVTPTPQAPPTEEATKTPAVEPVSKVPAYVTLGVAGGAAIAGTVFGVKALSAEDRYEKSPSVAHADDVERNALIADMAFGVAFTLGITGIVLLLTDEPTEPGASTETQALQVVPYVAPGRGGAVATMTF